jgi:hypothetical protein
MTMTRFAKLIAAVIAFDLFAGSAILVALHAYVAWVL